jgi:hypothetical protein
MLSTGDFIKKYELYSDEELYEVHATITGYSDEAQQAFETVLLQRGGIEGVISRLKEKQARQIEINRIEREAEKLAAAGFDAEFIRQGTASHLLTADEVHKITENKYAQAEAEKADKKITSRTIAGSIGGGLLSAAAGGTAWGLLLIYTQAYSPILFIGLFFVCYAVVKLCTRQSDKNTVVLIAAIAATLLAVGIGFGLYGLIGFRG